MDTLKEIAAIFGLFTAVVIAVVSAAYWLFRKFAESWLQSVFAEKLQHLRHEQDREIEHLKFRVNSLLDRSTKLHEREYQVLPSLWESLAIAWAEVGSYTSPVQSITNAAIMTNEELEEFLNRSDLLESQKKKVRTSSDRNLTLDDELYWHRKAKVTEYAKDFSRNLRFNAVFVPADIQNLMKGAEKILWNALTEKAFNQEDKPRPLERAARQRFQDEGEKTLNEIEALIRERLWSVSKLD